MTLSYSHGREFVDQVRPFLENHDPHGLVRYLDQYWPHDTLRKLLSCGCCDAVKVAAVCLALIGDMDDNAALASLLHSQDATTVAVAEHAMWSIWFRAGDERASLRLRRAVRLIGDDDFDAAIECLNRLVLHCPDFAEAYNQRAIAHFLKEDYVESLADCRRTLHLNPLHFGALAGIGHCHASMGQIEPALEAYCRALQVHPCMDGIRQSVLQIRRTLGTSGIEPPARPLRP